MNKSKKILFVIPKCSSTNFYTKFSSGILLGPLQLATILHNKGYTVNVLVDSFLTEKIEYYLKDIDILILTLLTMTAKRGYEIAKIYRTLNPRGRIIAGGIHTSFSPDEVLTYVDQIGIGEGYNIITDIIENGKDKIIKGYPLENLDEIPILNYGLVCNIKKIKYSIQIMTSLGCPHNCYFCCVTKMYGHKYRFQSPEKTIAEIKYQLTQFDTNRIFFTDDNFCANINRSIILLNLIKHNNLNISWSCQVRSEIARNENFIKLMSECGCHRVYVGFESINQKTLDSMNKREKVKDIKNAIRVFKKYGISIHSMFIFGTDADTIHIFKETRKFSLSTNVETLQIFTPMRLPGTDLTNSLEKERSLHSNSDWEDGLHIGYRPRLVSPFDLIQNILKAYRRFYSISHILKILVHNLFFLFFNTNRTIKYKIYKIKDNLLRELLFKYTMNKWEKNNRHYIRGLKSI